ncbi:hypothetical protein DL771_009490 [Monosporascus sp. 5C6A]|nr:hypothetical protein DL771_009490 [Monosporascus sp. 5C6A]
MADGSVHSGMASVKLARQSGVQAGSTPEIPAASLVNLGHHRHCGLDDDVASDAAHMNSRTLQPTHMSGAEVIGLISGIIAVVGATVKVYRAATDASGLPEAFRDVAKRLPLVQETLQTARGCLNTADPDEAFCNAIKPVLEGCEDKAKRLATIFEKVVPQADASRMERYLLAARTLGKGDTVESLMKGMLDDVQLLTGNHVAKLPTEAAIARLVRTAIDDVSAIPPSLPTGLDSSISYDAERNALLKELKWTDPTIDKLRIERTKGGLYEAASSWILAHPSYHQWRHDETKLLWIKGGAGKGKTMLLVAITRELRSCTKLDKPGADSFLSFFFCQNTDDRLNNAVAILKGLIYLLLVQDGSLISYLKDHYDRMGKEVFDVTSNTNAFDVLSNVFGRMIQHPRSETVYLAVDALDESEDGLPDLLGLVRESTLQEGRLKWIVTSRNRVDIDKHLALDNPAAKLSLEINSEAVSRAIEGYIDHKISQVPYLISNPRRQATVRQKLLDKADGTFLWVDLILRTIGGNDSVDGVGALGDDIVRIVDEIPSGLPPLYDRMMRNIGMSTSAYEAPCLAVLSITTLAYRPLHLLELRMLTGLEQHDTADLERIVDMCGSFLTLADSRIYPIHQSAKDYLVSEAAVGKIFPSGTHSVHRSIVDRSVAAMGKVLSRDIYGLVHPGTLIHEVMGPPAQDPLLGVGYSCAYWIDHVCKADQSGFQGNRRSRLAKVLRKLSTPSKSTRLRDLINTFFQHHFLHWLEALSLLGVVTNGVFSLTRLRNTFATARGDAFIDFIEDAYRIIRGLFAAEEPIWVLTKPIVEQNWSPCLQTLEGHRNSVRSVAFSPDCSRIVSGSDDETIKIWDAKSGEEIRTLKGHGSLVASVAFSPDGNHIASGSADRTVKIWDAKWGKGVRTLKHSRWVRSVAFSPDGSRIVSASHDRTVRTRDAKSGKEVRTLEGHRYPGPVRSVAFSPDGSRIASGSEDDTVKIWDAKSGREVRALEGHSNPVSSVAFSPDGNRIASGSDDRTVKIWDTKLGKEVRTLEGHRDPVRSVAFSTDGSRIASGSDDRTVKIWDAKLGKGVRTVKGHIDFVQMVVFSPDGSRIASTSYDHTIKIWDIKSGKEVHTLKGCSGWVNLATFSPDGSRIVSVSDEPTVKIWDTRSGKEVRTLKDHIDLVRAVAFSPDGTYLAFGSYDGTVMILDAKSGKEVCAEHLGSPLDRLHFESLSGSGLRLQTNAGSILLSVGNSTENHGGPNQVGDRSSLMIESNDQAFQMVDQQLASAIQRDVWWF